MTDIISPHNDQIEQVPDARILDILRDEFTNQVVGMVRISIQERGNKTQELALLKDRKRWLSRCAGLFSVEQSGEIDWWEMPTFRHTFIISGFLLKYGEPMAEKEIFWRASKRFS